MHTRNQQLQETIENIKLIKKHELFSGKFDSLGKVGKIVLDKIENTLSEIRRNIDHLRIVYFYVSKLDELLGWAKGCDKRGL